MSLLSGAIQQSQEQPMLSAKSMEALRTFAQLPDKYDKDFVAGQLPQLVRVLTNDNSLLRSVGVAKLHGLLGSGANAIVLAGEDRSGQGVAIKLSSPFRENVRGDAHRQQFQRERQVLEVLAKGEVPHTVRMLRNSTLSNGASDERVGALILERAAGVPVAHMLATLSPTAGATLYRQVYADLLEVAVRGAELGISFQDLDAHNTIVACTPEGCLQRTTAIDFGDCRLDSDSPEDALLETFQDSLIPSALLDPIPTSRGALRELQDVMSFIEAVHEDFQEKILDLPAALRMLRTGSYE